MIKTLIGFIFIVCVIVVGSVLWVKVDITNYMSAMLPITKDVEFEVKPGTNFKRLHNQLIEAGIVPTTKLTPFILKFNPELSGVKAGTYQAKVGMTVRQMYQNVLDNKEYLLSITLVEGKRFQDWLEQIQHAKELTIETTQLTEADIAKKIGSKYDKLEGLLLPETYRYTPGSTDIELLQRAYKDMEKFANKEWQVRQPNLPLVSSYQMLVLASIIEKETGLAEERGIVASVFINRLNKNMLLQTDPTVIYGLGDKYQGNLRKVDLTTATPYNTYVIAGLPPTPIAMPSKEAILATINPMKTEYYYFVATGNGGHHFSKTLAEHNQAVQNYLKVLKANKEGVSIVDETTNKAKTTNKTAGKHNRHNKVEPK